MPTARLAPLALAAMLLVPGTPRAAGPGDLAAIREATQGRFQAAQGKYFDKDCGQQLDYEAEAVDLNQDGKPEVFTVVHGTCLGGHAGMHVQLYVQNAGGKWAPQLGFPGGYEVLKTRNKGFADIRITGPGNCAPVWRWNGQAYDIHKKCR